MAKKDVINIDNTGVDKLEHFLQNNIKNIIIAVLSLIILAIAVYIGYSTYLKSVNNKINMIGESEVKAKDINTTKAFVNLSGTVPSLSNYIALAGAELFYQYNDNASAVNELKKVGGQFKEMGAGMLFDLGQSKETAEYLNGNMRELWYYRQVLASSPENKQKNIDMFKSLYPNSRLLVMLENWNN